MHLPYDYARCAGTTHPTCRTCRRREPGCEIRQAYIAPAINMLEGKCWNFIPPSETYTANSTVPNVLLTGPPSAGPVEM